MKFIKIAAVNVYNDRVPAIITAMLLPVGEDLSDTTDPSFFYGKPQVATSVKIIYVLSAIKVFDLAENYTEVCVFFTDNLHHSCSSPLFTAGRRLPGVSQSRKLYSE